MAIILKTAVGIAGAVTGFSAVMRTSVPALSDLNASPMARAALATLLAIAGAGTGIAASAAAIKNAQTDTKNNLVVEIASTTGRIIITGLIIHLGTRVAKIWGGIDFQPIQPGIPAMITTGITVFSRYILGYAEFSNIMGGIVTLIGAYHAEHYLQSLEFNLG